MRYNNLGNTGLIVSEICLGAMTFGESNGRFATIANLKQDEATGLVKKALEGGVNFIDTANVYSEGNSEIQVGGALRALGVSRPDVVIATKAYARMGAGSTRAGNSRKHLLDEVDASLKRMQLDYIDLYQVHGWDTQTPVEETMRAMDDLVRSGRVRYVGVSNWAAWHVAKAQGVAKAGGLEKIASIQSYYSLAGRDLEREIVPMMAGEGVGLMVWSPLAGGLLSGKYQREGKGIKGEGRIAAGGPRASIDLDKTFKIIETMQGIAKAHGTAVASVALAWVLQKPFVSSVIIGAKRPEQLAENLAASDLELSSAEIAQLDKLSELPPEYPGWMFADQWVRRGTASPRRPAPLPKG
jgi:aryl-alcohol dehydrogenase-like predicted oxidoreductase